MSQFSAAVAAGVVANVAFVLLVAVISYASFIGLRRGRMYNFWGLKPVRKIRIYVSHLYVVPRHPDCPEGRMGGAVAPDGNVRSFQGSAVTLLETEMATLLRRLFFASLPGRAVQPAWLRSLLLTNADAAVAPAPQAGKRIEGEGTVVALGSPAYNSVSGQIEVACRSPVRFINDNREIELPGGLTVQDPRQGVVVRLECSDRYWFYLAGISEGGTAAAAFFLATRWKHLHKKYRKIPSFYALVEFVGNDLRMVRLVSEGALYES